MNRFSKDDWMPLLSRLNSILLLSDDWKKHVGQDALSTGWCGAPPASEDEILKAEKRLGVQLPPSYRSFLLISNGWRPFDYFVECLLPVQEIEPYGVAKPEDLKLIQTYYREDDISDEIYLDYDTPKHNEAFRIRYYPESLLIGAPWGLGDLLLLNPQIVFPDGEWETIFFADWVPGNERYRSFHDYVLDSVDTTQRISESKSARK